MSEYSIHISSSKLYTIFPPTVCEDILCPQCDIHMIKNRPSKTNYRYNTNSAYCIKCGHEDSNFCRCNFCNEIRKVAKELREKEERRILQEKRKLIKEVYDIEKEERLNFQK